MHSIYLLGQDTYTHQVKRKTHREKERIIKLEKSIKEIQRPMEKHTKKPKRINDAICSHVHRIETAKIK